jgi:hypothetical protein
MTEKQGDKKIRIVSFTTALLGCPHAGVWFCSCFHLGVTHEGVAQDRRGMS